MGFFDKLFGKKKGNIAESDGQEEYFKEDFAPVNKKPAKKDEQNPSAVETRATKATKPAAREETSSLKTAKAATKATKSAERKENETSTKEKTGKKEVTPADEAIEIKSASMVKESKATANGKWDIQKAKDGRFFFTLYASNGAPIAYSQIYSSVSAVTTGINSVITNAEKSEVEDTTLQKKVSLPCPKWEIYIDKAGEYRFRLYATNGQCVCHSSHGYSTKSGCKGGIDSIRRFCGEAKVDKSYLK